MQNTDPSDKAPGWLPAPPYPTPAIVRATVSALVAAGLVSADEAMARSLYAAIHDALKASHRVRSVVTAILGLNLNVRNPYPEDACGLYGQGYRAAVQNAVELIDAVGDSADASLGRIESYVRSLICVNPHAEDKCRLYNEGFLHARDAAAEIILLASLASQSEQFPEEHSSAA